MTNTNKCTHCDNEPMFASSICTECAMQDEAVDLEAIRAVAEEAILEDYVCGCGQCDACNYGEPTTSVGACDFCDATHTKITHIGPNGGVMGICAACETKNAERAEAKHNDVDDRLERLERAGLSDVDDSMLDEALEAKQPF